MLTIVMVDKEALYGAMEVMKRWVLRILRIWRMKLRLMHTVMNAMEAMQGAVEAMQGAMEVMEENI